MLLLLTHWIIAGIAAEDLPVVHYQLENSSVCLHVRTPPPHHNAQWRLATTVIASPRPVVNPTFADKVDYAPGNHSLCFKKLSDRDGGIYEFSFNANFTSVSEKHKIVVQGMVPRPVIVLDANVSAGVCNMSVNCSVGTDWLWSFCDAHGCRTSQASLATVSITVSTGNRGVVCRGNNSVSASSAQESTTAECFSPAGREPPEAPRPPAVAVTALALGPCLLALLLFVAKRRLSVKHDQTSTAQLVRNQQAEPQTEPPASSRGQTDATYENVAALPPCAAERGSTAGQAVDNTVYSVLQPAKAKLPPGESGDSTVAGGPQRTHGAPVARGQAAPPIDVDTVYSMLQKPRQPQSQQQ